MGEQVIGGEFRIFPDAIEESVKSCIVPQYSLGRTCLYAILDAIKPKVGGVLLPDYMCVSVAKVPQRLGIPMNHYHVCPDFYPDLDDICTVAGEATKRLAILLISFFGLIDLNNMIESIRAEYPDMIIIVDDVQNYYGFGNHSDFDYCFTSYRKWFAVPDGADVICKEKAVKPYRFEISSSGYVFYKAAGNLLKNHRELIGDRVALELIDEGETMMDDDYLYGCSTLSTELLRRIDFESVAEKRKSNARKLHAGLARLGIQHLYDESTIPMFVPAVLKNRDKVRKRLFANNIFCPVHWPVDDMALQGNNVLYHTELSLICDQRYDEEDMERIIRGIENAM